VNAVLNKKTLVDTQNAIERKKRWPYDVAFHHVMVGTEEKWMEENGKERFEYHEGMFVKEGKVKAGRNGLFDLSAYEVSGRTINPNIVAKAVYEGKEDIISNTQMPIKYMMKKKGEVMSEVEKKEKKEITKTMVTEVLESMNQVLRPYTQTEMVLIPLHPKSYDLEASEGFEKLPTKPRYLERNKLLDRRCGESLEEVKKKIPSWASIEQSRREKKSNLAKDDWGCYGLYCSKHSKFEKTGAKLVQVGVVFFGTFKTDDNKFVQVYSSVIGLYPCYECGKEEHSVNRLNRKFERNMDRYSTFVFPRDEIFGESFKMVEAVCNKWLENKSYNRVHKLLPGILIDTYNEKRKGDIVSLRRAVEFPNNIGVYKKMFDWDELLRSKIRFWYWFVNETGTIEEFSKMCDHCVVPTPDRMKFRKDPHLGMYDLGFFHNQPAEGHTHKDAHELDQEVHQDFTRRYDLETKEVTVASCSEYPGLEGLWKPMMMSLPVHG
jgi:hypothetical protein